MKQAPTVALVNPLWVGHHPMYFGQFAAAFLRAGARVVGLCPEPEAAAAEIRLAAPDFAENALARRLESGRMSVLNDRFDGDPYHTFRRWQRAADAVRAAERETGRRVDLVYFPHLDPYLRFLPHPGVPAATLGKPWSGLYLRNHHHRPSGGPLRHRLRLLAKGEALIRSSLNRGLGVLDERFIDPLAAHTGQRVEAFPDVTLTELPETTPALTRDILDRAAGRKIIGLVGLERRKGAHTMLEVADLAHADGRPWFFVFAGVYAPDEFPAVERAAFDAAARDLRAGKIDHVHFDPDAPRIATEPEFNALFSRFDLAWAAYHGFPGSSGVLGKAAAFEIPVIASRGECIGHRVESHRLGETVPEADARAAYRAIDRLLAAADSSRDFSGYRRAHGAARLDGLIADLLARL